MKILVTGGSGVVGRSTITNLLSHGHGVRLLSRNASKDSREWPSGVEPFDADLSHPASIEGSADGCDAVLHIAGIVSEKLPDLTFQSVNVDGTRHLVAEANRAGVRRFVYISSLGADRGASDYHRSKLEAETETRDFRGDSWLILRPGNVYGPGDEVISLVLKLVRTLPVIPVIDKGDQEFQPVWHEDLADGIRMAIEREDLSSQVLELAGSERTTLTEVLKRLAAITHRAPLRIPVPGVVAGMAASAAGALGIESPLDANKLTMLEEGNVVRGTNALTDLFNVTPTTLDEGLRRLAEELPEQLPAEGYGPLRAKRFYADIEGSVVPREKLFADFRKNFSEVMPLEVGTEEQESRALDEGATISMKLPLRGTIQVRVEKVTATQVTLATLEGHPIAGMLRFSLTNHDGGIRFEVRLLDRSGTFFDYLAMETVGNVLQDANWVDVVQRMVDRSGGTAVKGIVRESKRLENEEAAEAENWAEEIVHERKRKAHARGAEDHERAEADR